MNNSTLPKTEIAANANPPPLEQDFLLRYYIMPGTQLSTQDPKPKTQVGLLEQLRDSLGRPWMLYRV